MTRDDLAFVADALLAICETEKRPPYYADHALKLKMQGDQRREPIFESLARRSGHDEMLRRECEAIMGKANLTCRQHQVLSLKLEGHTFEEIGRSGGHTKQGAQSIFSAALKKIMRAFRVYPYVGLSEVYRREVRRGPCRRPAK